MKRTLFLLVCIAAAFTGRAQNVVAAEYFIDTDAGFGRNTSVTVTPGADISIPLTTALAGIMPGPHILYMRTRDNSGAWSLTAWKNIQVLRSQNTTVLGLEYFFGTDPGFGRGNWMPFSAPAADGSFPVVLPPAQVTAGPQRIYLRTMDSDSSWSLTAWKDVTILIGVGISTVGGQDFRLYPNPSSGELHLDFSAVPRAPVTVKIINASGTLMQQQVLSGKSAVIRVDYPAGRYFLALNTGSETITRTVLIAK